MAGTDWGKAIGGIGDLVGAAGDLLGGQQSSAAYGIKAQGYEAEQRAFEKAQTQEKLNIGYAKASGDIQSAMAARKIYQSESGTQADVAAAGFKNSGNALDVLHSSASQGALTIGLIGTQTAIDMNNYQMQSDAYGMQAEQAGYAAKEAYAEGSASSSSNTFGAIAGAVGGIASIASAFI
jgi:hypothetical protein